jgi:hypothetical protein
MPQAITSARLASNAPVTSRKPKNLLGWVMPEKASPTPNIAPARRATSLAITAHLRTSGE